MSISTKPVGSHSQVLPSAAQEEGVRSLDVSVKILGSMSIGPEVVLAVNFFQGEKHSLMEMEGDQYIVAGKTHSWTLNSFDPNKDISMQLSLANNSKKFDVKDITELTRSSAAGKEVSLGTLNPFMRSGKFQLAHSLPLG